jgi:hypothetical protein
MSFDNFLELANKYPYILSGEMLLKVSTFLDYTPRFKNDILLAQDLTWPVDIAPIFLPDSVAILLMQLCDISIESLENLWSYLRETVWSLGEKRKGIDERFKLHGKDLGYGWHSSFLFSKRLPK